MNIILFANEAEARGLASKDARAVHIRKVLKMGQGDTLFIGVVNGPRGRATITKDCHDQGIEFETVWDEERPSPFPVRLIVGLPRPQTARKILQECTTLGVREICFFQSEKGEKSYAESKLWTSGEWERHLLSGAEQAFNTTVPNVRHADSLEACLEQLEGDGAAAESKIALDVYEAEGNLLKCDLSAAGAEAISIAIGPERGWSKTEREVLRGSGYQLMHLGDRVLRAETACVVAMTCAIRAVSIGN